VDSAVTEPTPKSWLRQHGVTLLIGAAVLALIFKYLHPLDVLIAAAGLGFIIFIHELGHFLAAKACDVHVKTFSIGFGPALPFCSHKVGETTYKLALVPLGGFVSMVGQEDGVVDETADPDPRSYRNKSVPQRMLIISAGVIMNVILAAGCFLAAYLHGVPEKPAVVAHIEPGSAAWRAGLTSGTLITKVGSWTNPVFDDIRPLAMSAQKGERLDVTVETNGVSRDLRIEPLKEEGKSFPVFGIAPPGKLELPYSRRETLTPAFPGSAAASASKDGEGNGFLAGDRIVGLTDPASGEVTPVTPRPGDPPFPYFEYQRRLARLAGRPVTYHVLRKGQSDGATPTALVVPPAFRRDLGLRMRMGPVTAVRTGSTAEAAGVVERTDATPGDRIVSVEVTDAGGGVTVYSTDPAPTDAGKRVRPLDPLRLPFELTKWADSGPKDRTVRVTVLRHVEHAEKRVPLAPMTWDDRFRFDLSSPSSSHAPVAIAGLGLAYQVLAVVDAVTPGGPAETAGVQPNDTVAGVTFTGLEGNGTTKVGKPQDIKPHHWPHVDQLYQAAAPLAEDPGVRTLALTVKRGTDTLTIPVVGTPDPTWPLEERGLDLLSATETQHAHSVGEALAMGAKRTMRTIRGTYLNLYGMVTGRTSLTMISGPITLARVSYLFAGQDPWLLVVLLGVISVNLAVVNFLPIPVLDGGHMVFLAYEGIRGKPAPERVQEYLVYVGLACVGSLMLLSIGMDVWRLFT
jgi:regulator of sigma E protease